MKDALQEAIRSPGKAQGVTPFPRTIKDVVAGLKVKTIGQIQIFPPGQLPTAEPPLKIQGRIRQVILWES